MKKIREGYKLTELGEIPEEWELKPLKEVVDINPESLGNKTNEDFILNYIDIESVTTGIVHNIKKYSFKEAPSRARRIVRKNDVIISTVRPYLKAFATIKDDRENLVCSTGFAVLRAKEDMNFQYLYQCTLSESFLNQLSNKMVGSNYPAVNSSDVQETLIPVPNLSEQQKISLILYSVDDQIEITNNLIEKTKELKKGLMQRLLIKGIGHSRFKDTEIGRIPEEWEVKRLSDISAKYNNSIVDGPFGSNLKTCDYTEEGILVMQSNYITGGKFELRDVRYISENKAKELERSKVKSGDILMAKIGANFGMAEIIPDSIRYGILSSNSLKIDLNDNIAINEFYLFILKLFKQNGTINKFASTTAQPALSLKAIKDLKVPVPPLNEQKQISLILLSLDEQIDQYKSKKLKLQELKKGLMQKLLTGSIKVKM